MKGPPVFKNKTFIVKMVDDKKVETPETPKPNYGGDHSPRYWEVLTVVEDIGVMAMAGVGFYIAADTLRKVIVHTAEVKIK